MKIDWKIITIGIMAAGWYHDAKLGMRYQKRFKKADADRIKAENLANLYADEINRSRMPVSDFTKIAMHTIFD